MINREAARHFAGPFSFKPDPICTDYPEPEPVPADEQLIITDAPARKPMMRVYGQILKAQRMVRHALRTCRLSTRLFAGEQRAVRDLIAKLPTVRDYVPPTPPIVNPDYVPQAFLDKLASIGQPGKVKPTVQEAYIM